MKPQWFVHGGKRKRKKKTPRKKKENVYGGGRETVWSLLKLYIQVLPREEALGRGRLRSMATALPCEPSAPGRMTWEFQVSWWIKSWDPQVWSKRLPGRNQHTTPAPSCSHSEQGDCGLERCQAKLRALHHCFRNKAHRVLCRGSKHLPRVTSKAGVSKGPQDITSGVFRTEMAESEGWEYSQDVVSQRARGGIQCSPYTYSISTAPAEIPQVMVATQKPPSTRCCHIVQTAGISPVPVDSSLIIFPH